MYVPAVGLVGEPGVGKGEVAKYLQTIGFAYYSLSDSLRRIADSVGVAHTREHLTTLGNTQRELFGADILARGAGRWYNDQTVPCVIDAIRHPKEVEYLDEEWGVFILGVGMPERKMFDLMLVRNREGDPKTWDDFLAMRKAELGAIENDDESKENNEARVQVAACLAEAEGYIDNSGSKEDLYRATHELLLAHEIIPETMPFGLERR